MFKIAKLEQVKNENVDINLIKQELSKYENGKKVIQESFETLSFSIYGDDYLLSFDLNCKLEKLLEIPINKKIDFKDYLLDGSTWLNAKDLDNIDPEIDIKITRYLKNKFIIFITFYTNYSSIKYNYSGILEFTFNLDDYIK